MQENSINTGIKDGLQAADSIVITAKCERPEGSIVIGTINDLQKRSIFQLFKVCFTDIPITEDIFFTLFDYTKCDIISIFNKNNLIGFLAIHENKIIILCVAPEYQHRGYGRQLVQESEKLIMKKGYDTVVLGGTDSKLFLGAVTDEKEWCNRHNPFFEKCGYAAENGCLEMVMSLQDYDITNLGIELYPEGITFEYWSKADRTELLSAVSEVEEDWVQYFAPDNSYFVAMERGKCVGFTILSFDDTTLCSNGHNKVGMVGCVGVIPSHRNNGIGLAMVAHATNELKKNGCDLSFIHYTYLDRWYGKLGYKSILWYWFGMKSLK